MGTAELAQEAIKKAMTDSPKFNTTYNEIPVFLISQMRMQKAPAEGEEGKEPITMMPMYFSLQNLVTTWQQFMAQAPANVQNVEPSINLMSLHDMIDLMQKESPIDFRTVILMPAAPAAEGGAAAVGSPETVGTPTVHNPMNNMGGST